MADQVPEISAHHAKDRFGKIAVHAAHEISRALAESGERDDGVVVLRMNGPHRSLAGLERLIDDVLAGEDEPPSP
ncbi:MAG: hypothetical protein ACRDSP_05175 [Pseudonocardiaceae bacterium]